MHRQQRAAMMDERRVTLIRERLLCLHYRGTHTHTHTHFQTFFRKKNCGILLKVADTKVRRQLLCKNQIFHITRFFM